MHPKRLLTGDDCAFHLLKYNFMKRLKEIFKIIASGEIQMVAAALSFTTLLSIIPFFVVGLATLQIFDGLDRFSVQVQGLLLEFFKGAVKANEVQTIKGILKSFQPESLGALGALGLIITSMMMIREMEKAFHFIWKIPNKRPLFKRVFSYWVLLLTFPIAAAVLVSLTSVKAFVWMTSGFPKSGTQFLFSLAVCTLVFKTVPNIKVRWTSSLVGGAVSALGIVGLIHFYSIATQHLFSYSKFYGGLASVPAFLIWVLSLWYVVLLGVAVSSIWNKTVPA
jgi:membrane protein